MKNFYKKRLAKYQALKPSGGFAILDVVVATGIVAVGLMGVTALVVQNIRVFSINKDKLIATMLAQEGVELVRNYRDSNWKAGNSWKTGLSATFMIDSTHIITPVAGISSARLYITGDGEYLHTAPGNTQTKFFRMITTDTPAACPDADDCLRVISQVQWTGGGANSNFQVETYLYDWF